jgi:hypothetical protein
MQKRILCYAVACLLSLNVFSQYIYEGNQSLIDLTNESNTTNLNSGDDQLSSAFNLDFTFNFYDKQFTSARMATNGCLHFGLGTGNVNYNDYCGDYTPDPLPQYNYTLFPFWTDLIRANNSQMLAKNFNDKTVFGWYDMREYSRASNNSFEVILWTNSTFDFRYGDLDIIQHDVLIGQQKDSDTYYEYLFYDECNTGSTNSSSCVSVDWNNSDKNQNLESGGSLYGTSDTIDCSNPLNDVSCAGYWEAYDDFQCDLDPQYGPFCQGYRQEEDIGYYQEEEYFDYGYEEELFDYGYEEYDMYDVFEEPEIFEEYIFESEYDNFEEPEYVFEEDIIFEQLQPLDEFVEPLPFMRDEEVFIPIEDLMIEEFVFQETFIEEVEEWFEEETIVEEELAYAEEPEEELIEELVEEEEVIEEDIEEELVAEEKGSSLTKEKSLAVVASTIKTARNSIYTTTSGNTSTNSSSNLATSSSTSASSTGSLSNSPSISDQFSSSTAQTNQLLDMSTTVTATATSTNSVDSSMSSTTSTTFSSNTNTNNSIQNQIDTSVSSGGDTDAEQLVENIIAQNLQAAQNDVEAKQEETGEYGSENTIIAYMGFVPNFNNYRLVTLPEQETWYESTDIYANNMLSDNIEGFYQMAGQSLDTLTEMKKLQPKL